MTVEPSLEAQVLQPIYIVSPTNDKLSSCVEHLPAPYGSLNPQVMLAELTLNQRITTEDHFQDCRKVTFKLPKGHP